VFIQHTAAEKKTVSNLQKAKKQTNYTKNLINRTIHLHIRKKSSNFAADITYIYIIRYEKEYYIIRIFPIMQSQLGCLFLNLVDSFFC
jgi:hypothetical protein